MNKYRIVLFVLLALCIPVNVNSGTIFDNVGGIGWVGINTGLIHGPNEEEVPNAGLGLVGGWDIYKWLDAEVEGSLGYYGYRGTNSSGSFTLHFRSRAIIPLFKIKSVGINWVMGAGLTFIESSDGIYIDKKHDFMDDRNPYLTYEGGFRFKKDNRMLFDLTMEHVENINHHDRGVNFVYFRFPFWWE